MHIKVFLLSNCWCCIWLYQHTVKSSLCNFYVACCILLFLFVNNNKLILVIIICLLCDYLLKYTLLMHYTSSLGVSTFIFFANNNLSEICLPLAKYQKPELIAEVTKGEYLQNTTAPLDDRFIAPGNFKSPYRLTGCFTKTLQCCQDCKGPSRYSNTENKTM